MQELIDRLLIASHLGLVTPVALLLGIISAIGSCCNIPMFGALAGYAGTKEDNKIRDAVLAATSFMVGTVVALGVIGAVVGYVGQIAATSFGRYSKVFAGLMLIIFGLIALRLVPLNRLPQLKLRVRKYPKGMLGAVVLGFALGGASIACGVSCCSPALLVVVGLAGLQGQVLRGAILMVAFALGYGIPLAAILLGLSFGKLALRTGRAMHFIRIAGGILLLLVGFYFLIAP